MSSSPYAYQHYLLRSLTTEFGLPDIRSLALQPGSQSIYRFTCHYPYTLPPNSVATLAYTQTSNPTLTVVYEGVPGASVKQEVDKPTYTAFVKLLAAMKFDRLEDQPGIPQRDVTLWLVERAAGSFSKSVLIAPELAQESYETLVHQLREMFTVAVQPLGQVGDGGD